MCIATAINYDTVFKSSSCVFEFLSLGDEDDEEGDEEMRRKKKLVLDSSL
jgi:hypothetical protein